MGDNLTYLRVEALTHLGTTMIDLNAAIGVDVYQCTRLIKVFGGKRDTEFNGRQCKALFNDRALLIKRSDFLSALPILTGFR